VISSIMVDIIIYVVLLVIAYELWRLNVKLSEHIRDCKEKERL
jgi:hypothetical protein